MEEEQALNDNKRKKPTGTSLASESKAEQVIHVRMLIALLADDDDGAHDKKGGRGKKLASNQPSLDRRSSVVDDLLSASSTANNQPEPQEPLKVNHLDQFTALIAVGVRFTTSDALDPFVSLFSQPRMFHLVTTKC